MHIPDDEEAIQLQVDAAMAGLTGSLLDNSAAGTLRTYVQQLEETSHIPMLERKSDEEPIPLVLTLPAWRRAEAGEEARVGGILKGRPFLAHGMNLEHDVAVHDILGIERQRFTISFGGLSHYHGCGPIRYQLRETVRGPVLRMALDVVEHTVPKTLLVRILSEMAETMAGLLDPEDFEA